MNSDMGFSVKFSAALARACRWNLKYNLRESGAKPHNCFVFVFCKEMSVKGSNGFK